MWLSYLIQPASVQAPPGPSKLQSAIQTVSESAFVTAGSAGSTTSSSVWGLVISTGGGGAPQTAAAVNTAAAAGANVKKRRTTLARSAITVPPRWARTALRFASWARREGRCRGPVAEGELGRTERLLQHHRAIKHGLRALRSHFKSMSFRVA